MKARNSKEFDDALAGALGALAVDDEASNHQIDGLSPQATVYPASVEELRGILAVAHQWDKAVAPWGGGTRMAVGNTPERLDLVVNLSRLGDVIEHNPGDLTATVQAGITLAKLQEALGKHGQFLALDPPLPHRATLGGTLAIGASGPLKWLYGSPRDVVIGMKVVHADGQVTKSGGQVVKNVSGYDMSRLHIGGIGTLGVIAEVSLKLTPLPDDETTVLAEYQHSAQCLGAALDIFHGDVVPLALTTFDREASRRIEGGEPRGAHSLAVRVGGRPLTLQRQIRECQQACQRHGPSQVEVLVNGDATSLWRSLADFGWDESSSPQIGARVSLPPSRVPEFIEGLQRLEESGGLLLAIVSHPAHGTVLIGWFGSGDGLSTDAAAGVIRYTTEAVHILGGKTVVERCPPEVKPHIDVWDDPGESLSIMRRLKNQYDPKRVLNPGRFAGGI